MSPDIIGLQECDTARIAGGNADIVSYFANHLDMYSYYGPSNVTGTFGIALLSRYPIENPKTYYLFSIGEQVAVIEAEITVGDQTFNIYVTHLGNGGPIFQMRQMLELMRGKSNIIAMGDFNFRPYEEQYKITTVELNDAYQIAQTKTIPSLWGETKPFDIGERIDHIFISEGLQVPYLEYLTQPESDHPGLFAEIGW
ncbi:MAG: endonuclease/exonuclease/phosphatase family protein [Anaerolineales bacterium]|jgi:endonuclease/exonuclease/phosphatase family metal-dependent hydrolase